MEGRKNGVSGTSKEPIVYMVELEISSLGFVGLMGVQPSVSLDKANDKCGEGGDIKEEGGFLWVRRTNTPTLDQAKFQWWT